MTSFTKDGRRYEYSYNSDGMRTVKRVYEGDELVYTYTYIWDGDVLLAGRMEVTDADEPITIRYLYDESGELYGMDYNGNGYFAFIKNLQGDIVSIVPLNPESNVEINMEYDAWGKPIFEDSSLGASFVKAMIMAATNVGYRGYFYDFDTGLYYLRSRYYDPETGRFINADDTEQLKVPSELTCGISNEVLIINMFAYCGNNPIIRQDPDGQSSFQFTLPGFDIVLVLRSILLIINWFGEADAYYAEKFNYKGEAMGHLIVKFEASYEDVQLYNFLDMLPHKLLPLLITLIAQNLLSAFRNQYGREFLLSLECVTKEIYDHFVGYMWSIGVSGYELPPYMQMYGTYCALHGSGYRSAIYWACVDADIYEKDVYATEWNAKAESKAFNYYNGINSGYKSTKKDPYYYPSTKMRINKYNKSWDKKFFIL